MKKINLYFSICLVIFFTGCDDFIDVNQNPNSPEDVQEKLLLPPIEYNLAHNVVAGWASIHVNHFMQTIALNQTVPNVGTYLMVPTDEDDTWNYLYATCLQNLHLLNQKGEENGNLRYAGIAKILTAYCLGYGTDLWGDIPYSEAFRGGADFFPVYDKQEEVYATIQALLDAGISDIAKATGLQPGSDDFIYQGDDAQWTKAAYTLKARYYMHLTGAPGHSGVTQANLALSALEKGMQSNDDDLAFPYPGGSGMENRWFKNFLPLETIVMASKAVDSLVARQDPRLPYLVAPSIAEGKYAGRAIGTVGIGNLQSYSLAGPFWAAENASMMLMSYREALFLKAEATMMTSGYAAAQPIYEKAIREDMAKVGVSDNDAINAYLAKRAQLTAENALQRIMEEKSVAGLLSVENYTDWRRTGFPELEIVPNALYPEIPRRLLYPNVETSTNFQDQHKATLLNRVWWDQR